MALLLYFSLWFLKHGLMGVGMNLLRTLLPVKQKGHGDSTAIPRCASIARLTAEDAYASPSAGKKSIVFNLGFLDFQLTF
jgi:hypothetical protein